MVVDDRVVRVSVEDASNDLPQLREVAPTSLSGRGMKLVDSLSSIWGADFMAGGGKQVWFEVPFRWS
jgi:hypothetical protein